MSIKDRLRGYSHEVEEALRGLLKGKGIPAGLREAMEYSLLAGGKRLRPVLCLCFARMLGAEARAAMPFAASLEFIHTYSLIHDDLPAMDDDDLRRGRPSNHKVFGEAMAILAGDGLLTEAFGLMASTAGELPPGRVVEAIATLARAAGAGGMVGGQALDMAYTAKAGVSLEELREMQAMKTGALITAACVCGAQLAGAEPDVLARARSYGQSVGAAFQIVDDVLDVVGDEKALGKPVGSDEEQGKTTYPALIGVERSMDLARRNAAQAVESLSPFQGPEATFLRDLAQFIVDRVS
ncbi:Farnesyl diphosphate synthase [Fundidesulfovibrio magnetotacticus]|uniref:Farnesyl diphosphate synthase n=1 Tax=Fundidesulfovibrio magnetotacticus TaxID=2730080 RepID=A0A6V8M0L5_9BACT|nr:farnesyl diphosphate synthase [Fundidesulfovibrio magnetotacticus]GFK95556.1 Farnesyl diphosphate synthase [Fundidesulfovibrio magnetotacticus]